MLMILIEGILLACEYGHAEIALYILSLITSKGLWHRKTVQLDMIWFGSVSRAYNSNHIVLALRIISMWNNYCYNIHAGGYTWACFKQNLYSTDMYYNIYESYICSTLKANERIDNESITEFERFMLEHSAKNQSELSELMTSP